MNPLTSISTSSATSALRTLKDLAEAQDAASLKNSAGDEKYPTLLSAIDSHGPAVINDVQDIRTKFSAQEIRAVEIALGPVSVGNTSEMNAQALEHTLGGIASRRDKGEDVSLIVTRFPGGGSIATVMSKSELAAALDSDDPASMGSFQGADGKKIYLKDAIKQLAGLIDKSDISDPKLSIAKGIVKNLQSADNNEPKENTPLALDDAKKFAAVSFRNNEYSVSVLRFQAVSGGSEAKSSYTSSGLES